MPKKVDWDFRFIMGVFFLALIALIAICFKAYPAQSQAALDTTAKFVLPLVAADIIYLAVVQYRRWKQEELAKEAAVSRKR